MNNQTSSQTQIAQAGDLVLLNGYGWRVAEILANGEARCFPHGLRRPRGIESITIDPQLPAEAFIRQEPETLVRHKEGLVFFNGAGL